MPQDFVDGMGAEVSARQALQKRLQLLPSRGRKRPEMVKNLVLCIAVNALVHAAIEVVGSADVELPQVLGLPRCERFRVDGLDIRVREKAQHLQQLRAANALGELRDGARIENIAAQSKAQILMVRNKEENRLAIGLGKVEAREAFSGELQARG